MEFHEEWINAVKLSHLREQLNLGIDQLNRGDGIDIKSKRELDNLFQDLLE